MDTKHREEVVINVHKGLRKGLLELSIRLGRLNWLDREELRAADAEFGRMLRFLREHATNEDEVQFPMVQKTDPDTVRIVEEDHIRLKRNLFDLESHWNKVLQSQDKSRPGYEFYRAYNRYLSDYLAHMDREEGVFTEAIYRRFNDLEIAAEFKKIIARTLPQDMGLMLGYMIPAMNHTERVDFLTKLKATAPPEVFEKVRALAQTVLPREESEKLSAQMG